VEGIAAGCRQSGCALLGGETAEMPGFYAPGCYDLAGFCVAVVEADQLIDGHRIEAGDRIVAVASSGVHSNGFSLVRRILEEQQQRNPSAVMAPLSGEDRPLIEALLTPTRIYAALVKTLLAAEVPVHGMAHITGGGLPENLPRCLGEGMHGAIDPDSWQRPALFRWLQEAGQVPETDLWNTFNLGVGFCLVLPPAATDAALALCRQTGHDAWVLGEVRSGVLPTGTALAGLPT
jgi:phosphoribosylformylglycinamidine cyclo-ligase